VRARSVVSLVISAGTRHVAGTSWRLGSALAHARRSGLNGCSPHWLPQLVELHPVQQGVVGDGAGVGRALAQGLADALEPGKIGGRGEPQPVSMRDHSAGLGEG
jgi:hypothetical protein